MKHPTPWRVGTKVPRNIYDANDEGIVMVGDEETAKIIVESVNSTAKLREALEWYADQKNHEGHAVGYEWGNKIEEDKGAKAREVLGQK